MDDPKPLVETLLGSTLTAVAQTGSFVDDTVGGTLEGVSKGLKDGNVLAGIVNGLSKGFSMGFSKFLYEALPKLLEGEWIA